MDDKLVERVARAIRDAAPPGIWTLWRGGYESTMARAAIREMEQTQPEQPIPYNVYWKTHWDKAQARLAELERQVNDTEATYEEARRKWHKRMQELEQELADACTDLERERPFVAAYREAREENERLREGNDVARYNWEIEFKRAEQAEQRVADLEAGLREIAVLGSGAAFEKARALVEGK